MPAASSFSSTTYPFGSPPTFALSVSSMGVMTALSGATTLHLGLCICQNTCSQSNPCTPTAWVQTLSNPAAGPATSTAAGALDGSNQVFWSMVGMEIGLNPTTNAVFNYVGLYYQTSDPALWQITNNLDYSINGLLVQTF